MIDPAQHRFDEISANFPSADRLRIEYYAEVIDWRQLTSLQDAQALQSQHIWRNEVIAQRFDWGRTKDIFVFAVRVFSLPHHRELPMASSYGGCKSWVELEDDVATEGATPVVSDDIFARKLNEFQRALEPVAQSSHPP